MSFYEFLYVLLAAFLVVWAVRVQIFTLEDSDGSAPYGFAFSWILVLVAIVGGVYVF